MMTSLIMYGINILDILKNKTHGMGIMTVSTLKILFSIDYKYKKLIAILEMARRSVYEPSLLVAESLKSPDYDRIP